jgi:hypothetical protein
LCWKGRAFKNKNEEYKRKEKKYSPEEMAG